MLMIRLKRTGRKNNPSFRIVVTEKSRGPKSNKYVENLGFYNPREGVTEIDKERAEYWISKGAKPSGTVHNMLVDKGAIKGKKINVLPQKSPVEKEATEEPVSEKKDTDSADGASPSTVGTEEAPSAEEEKSDTTEEAPADEPAKEESPEESTPEDKTEEVDNTEKAEETTPDTSGQAAEAGQEKEDVKEEAPTEAVASEEEEQK